MLFDTTDIFQRMKFHFLRVLQAEDFAELILSGLKLPRRAMLKSAALWSTNP